MSHYHPPPPGVDGRSNTSRYGPPPAPPGSNSYRPAPPSYPAPPPPSSRDYDSYAPNRYNNDRDRDRARGRDRGRDHDDRSDRYQPSRRSDNHPLPPRPQPSSYRDYRDGGGSFRPPQSDFTFSSDKPSGVGDSYNSYRPSDSNGPRNPRRGPARGGYDRGPRFGNDRGGRYGGPNQARRIWKPFKPAERAILQPNLNDEPGEDYADAANGVVYKAFDQLSDSDEADMDMSDSENESAEPTAKRARTTVQAASGDSVPKWSNPDPYTALPPTEDSDKKKKDMVQLIRKARVQAAQGSRTSLPADDEDFIRCDTDSDGDDGNDDDEEVFIDPLTYKRDKDNGQGSSAPNPVQPSGSLAARISLPSKPDFAQFGSPAATAPARMPPAVASTAATSSKRAADVIDLTNSPNLGSRKRTYDDVLKLPAHAKLKPAPKQPVGGKIVPEWKAKPHENPCPWVCAPSAEFSLNTRFHMEVKDFYDHVKPRVYEERLRNKLIDDLNRLLSTKGRWQERKMYPFGSFMSGLYLPTGDMDLVYCSTTFVNGGPARLFPSNQQSHLARLLQSERVAVNSRVDSIRKARVPLAKYVDQTTGLKVDISFENTGGLVAISTFKAWKEQYPAMPILVTVVKQFLLMRGLNEPVNGGIGGFSVICMVVSMLQLMPPVQSGDMVPEHHLGSLLMHFFDLYGNRFNYKTTALRLNPPGYVNKVRLSLETLLPVLTSHCHCRTKSEISRTSIPRVCPLSTRTIQPMTSPADRATTHKLRSVSQRHTGPSKSDCCACPKARILSAFLMRS